MKSVGECSLDQPYIITVKENKKLTPAEDKTPNLLFVEI